MGHFLHLKKRHSPGTKRDFMRMGNGHLSTEKRYPSDFDRGIDEKGIGSFLERKKGAHIIFKRVIIRGEKGQLSLLKRDTARTC